MGEYSCESACLTFTADRSNGDKIIYKMFSPPQYFDPCASQEEVQVIDYLKGLLESLASGEVNSILLPNVRDENGNRMFDLEVVTIPNGERKDE